MSKKKMICKNLLRQLLDAFQITVLKQSDFELIYTQEQVCAGLITKLNSIIPYFKIWVSEENKDERIQKNLSQLDNKVDSLKIYEADTLQIKYGGIDFIKSCSLDIEIVAHLRNRQKCRLNL